MTAAETFSHWTSIRQGLLSLLDRLADDGLAFTPRDGLWSIGTLFCHVAEAEDGWFRYVARRELPDWPTYPPESYPTVAALRALLGEVHERTERTLAAWDAADLDRIVDTPWGEPCSLRWIVWHVLEHEIHHRGELSLIFGLMGLQGLDV